MNELLLLLIALIAEEYADDEHRDHNDREDDKQRPLGLQLFILSELLLLKGAAAYFVRFQLSVSSAQNILPLVLGLLYRIW